MSPGTTMYWLVSPALLCTLMKRTGSGLPISTRDLASAAGVSKGTISNLRTGYTRAQPRSVAEAIAHRIGVDEFILWAPLGRADSMSPAEQPVTEAVPA
jgi:transcriptional regulator with XRE-family HTH domain